MFQLLCFTKRQIFLFFLSCAFNIFQLNILIVLKITFNFFYKFIVEFLGLKNIQINFTFILFQNIYKKNGVQNILTIESPRIVKKKYLTIGVSETPSCNPLAFSIRLMVTPLQFCIPTFGQTIIIVPKLFKKKKKYIYIYILCLKNLLHNSKCQTQIKKF
jgi:hypothetical protein